MEERAGATVRIATLVKTTIVSNTQYTWYKVTLCQLLGTNLRPPLSFGLPCCRCRCRPHLYYRCRHRPPLRRHPPETLDRPRPEPSQMRLPPLACHTLLSAPSQVGGQSPARATQGPPPSLRATVMASRVPPVYPPATSLAELLLKLHQKWETRICCSQEA